MNRKWICFALFAAAFIFSEHANAQKRTLRRAMEMRGTDSAWIFSPTFGRDRFFMGNEQVTQLEFLNRIRSSDREVAALMDKGQRLLITGRILEGVGACLTIAGWLVYDPYSFNPNQSRNNAGMALLFTGLGMDLTGLFFLIPGTRKYRQGIQLFNLKARRNEFDNAGAGLFLGAGSNGIGLRLGL